MKNGTLSGLTDKVVVNIARVRAQLNVHHNVEKVTLDDRTSYSGERASIIVRFHDGHEVRISIEEHKYGLCQHQCKKTLAAHQTLVSDPTHYLGKMYASMFNSVYKWVLMNTTNGYNTFGYFDGRTSPDHDGVFGNLHKYMQLSPEDRPWGYM